MDVQTHFKPPLTNKIFHGNPDADTDAVNMMTAIALHVFHTDELKSVMNGQKEKEMDIRTKSIMKFQIFQSLGQNKDEKSILSKNIILLNSRNNRVILILWYPTRPRSYKTFLMLNSNEHEISNAHKN